ncbi:cation transporter [Microbulbifer sp. CnH-101-G]|uniref:cation transporter n=1 Tax=Microbulbifer sp. CnH-101-G TaxID=3243393 RepID=UPI00403A4388
MSECGCGLEQADKLERSTLMVLLVINAIMFVLELTLGWFAQSTGLIADSLDMLADAAVYGISLFVVGRGVVFQAKAANVSGIIQIILGLWVLYEVCRRSLFGSEPESILMVSIGASALLANVVCLLIISKYREGGVHMRAAWIFSANDVVANLGVIMSGLLVAIIDSRFPDLAIGLIISAVVIRGGFLILKEARESTRKAKIS